MPPSTCTHFDSIKFAFLTEKFLLQIGQTIQILRQMESVRRFCYPRQGNWQPPCSYHADRPAPERKWRMGRKVPQGIRPGRERPAPSQMEKRGIRTDKGEVNRQIVSDNKLLGEIKARITRLYNWSKAEAEKPEGHPHRAGRCGCSTTSTSLSASSLPR